jgi:hypothetical protein
LESTHTPHGTQRGQGRGRTRRGGSSSGSTLPQDAHLTLTVTGGGVRVGRPFGARWRSPVRGSAR